MEKYDKILKSFVSKDDHPTRQWMTKPFIIDDLAISTNSYALVWTKDFVGKYEPVEPTKIDKIKELINEETYLVKINIEDILTELNKVEKSSNKCSSCMGDGEVEYSYYSDSNNEYYYEELECPVCRGSGENNNNGDYSNNECANIKGVEIGLNELAKTIGNAKYLELNEIEFGQAGIYAFCRLDKISYLFVNPYDGKLRFKIS